MILSTKRSNVSQWVFVAAHFDQFLAIWLEYGLVNMSYNNDPHNQVFL